MSPRKKKAALFAFFQRRRSSRSPAEMERRRSPFPSSTISPRIRSAPQWKLSTGGPRRYCCQQQYLGGRRVDKSCPPPLACGARRGDLRLAPEDVHGRVGEEAG